jgi:hypothetical protein
MPITFQKATSPGGMLYAHTVSAGEISPADAVDFEKKIGPGGDYENLPMLAVVAPGASYSPQARQALAAMGTGPLPIAVVVSSAPLRVMLAFVARASNAKVKFFGAEPEAIAWLEAGRSA